MSIRFSLRNLLLFTSLLAAAVMLFRNSAAWRPILTLDQTVERSSKSGIVTSGSAGSFQFWNLDGQVTDKVTCPSAEFCGFSDDEQHAIFFKKNSNFVEVFNRASKTWEHREVPVEKCARVITLDSSWSIVQDSSSKIYFWDFKTNAILSIRDNEKFDFKNNTVYEWGADGLTIRSVATGERSLIPLPEGEFIGHGRILGVWKARTENFVRVVDMKARKTVLQIPFERPLDPKSQCDVSFDETEGRVIVWDFHLSGNSSAQVWSVPEQKLLREIQWRRASEPRDFVRFMPDNQTLLLSTYVNGSGDDIYLWKADSAAPDFYTHMAHNSKVPTIGIENPTARLFDLTDAAELYTFNGYDSFSILTRDRVLVSNYKENTHTLFARNRTEQWWGIASLPELWVTLILAGALAWSLGLLRKPKPSFLAVCLSVGLIAYYLLCVYSKETTMYKLRGHKLSISFKHDIFGNGSLWIKKGAYEKRICTYKPAADKEQVSIGGYMDGSGIIIRIFDAMTQTDKVSYKISDVDSDTPKASVTTEMLPFVVE